MEKMKKIQNTRGETISEVLIAALVGSLGVLLSATMIVASVKIADKGMKKMSEYAEIESAVETKTEGGNAGITTQENSLVIQKAEGAEMYGSNIAISMAQKKHSVVTLYGDTKSGVFSYEIKK